MFIFYFLGVGPPCCSILCQFWLCEEAQCVYLRRHLGSPLIVFFVYALPPVLYSELRENGGNICCAHHCTPVSTRAPAQGNKASNLCLKTPVGVGAAAGETPRLTGEVVGETHGGLECAQAHPLLSLIHISEPTRHICLSRMPSSA